MAVTQYAMKPVESVGMLKIDFLGLKTLTSIQKCVDAIAQQYGTADRLGQSAPRRSSRRSIFSTKGKPSAYSSSSRAGCRILAKQLHIDTFEEIIAVGALYRPGPMDMIPSFINRKHGREADRDRPSAHERDPCPRPMASWSIKSR